MQCTRIWMRAWLTCSINCLHGRKRLASPLPPYKAEASLRKMSKENKLEAQGKSYRATAPTWLVWRSKMKSTEGLPNHRVTSSPQRSLPLSRKPPRITGACCTQGHQEQWDTSPHARSAQILEGAAGPQLPKHPVLSSVLSPLPDPAAGLGAVVSPSLLHETTLYSYPIQHQFTKTPDTLGFAIFFPPKDLIPCD